MYRRAAWCLVFALLLFGATARVRSAGLTIITHGLNSNIDDWVIAMAQKIPRYPNFPGTNFACYELYFVASNPGYALTWRRLAGTTPNESGEIVVKLDWRQLANNSYSTYQVAAMVVPKLLERDFISEWPGHALAELPIHMIGHSRGGSLICELSNLLGTNGIWVDHLTTLDPHPLNNDSFSDYPYTVVDAPARTYQNVLFHDNYFQKIDSLFNGESVAGAYVRQLTNLDGGYSGFASAHSDVHLWYHGTVDTQTPTTDSVSAITATERQQWWNGYENGGVNAGYRYSRTGGGDRMSTNQPTGSGSRIRDSYNQRWELGAGTQNNRTALSTNRGDWASLIKADPGTNAVAFGQSMRLFVSYQWARPDASNATINVFWDNDWNPFNGNEQQLGQIRVTGTGGASVGTSGPSFMVGATNATPGEHLLFLQIVANGQSRYLYAAQPVKVMSSFAAPNLQLSSNSGPGPHLSINGLAGQRLVLETSTDLNSWRSIATNWMIQSSWEYIDQSATGNQSFYRAAVR